MSKQALRIAIKRKKILSSNRQKNKQEADNLLLKIEKLGGLTAEEKYVLLFS